MRCLALKSRSEYILIVMWTTNCLRVHSCSSWLHSCMQEGHTAASTLARRRIHPPPHPYGTIWPRQPLELQLHVHLRPVQTMVRLRRGLVTRESLVRLTHDTRCIAASFRNTSQSVTQSRHLFPSTFANVSIRSEFQGNYQSQRCAPILCARMLVFVCACVCAIQDMQTHPLARA